MADQISIGLPDGSCVELPDANWLTLVSAGLSDQQLRVLKHSDGRVLVYGRIGKLAQGEILSGKPAREEIDMGLRRVCTRLEMPLDLMYSCMNRMSARS